MRGVRCVQCGQMPVFSQEIEGVYLRGNKFYHINCYHILNSGFGNKEVAEGLGKSTYYSNEMGDSEFIGLHYMGKIDDKLYDSLDPKKHHMQLSTLLLISSFMEEGKRDEFIGKYISDIFLTHDSKKVAEILGSTTGSLVKWIDKWTKVKNKC
jgi:hypothetical protein